MKTFAGIFKANGIYYQDSVIAPFKWIAKIMLKRRNSGKLIRIIKY